MTPDPSNANGGVGVRRDALTDLADDLEFIFDGQVDINDEGGPNDAMKAMQIVGRLRNMAHFAAPPSPGAGLSEALPDFALIAQLLKDYAASIPAADVELHHYIPAIEEQAERMEAWNIARRLGATNAEAVALLCVNDEGCELAIKRRSDGRWEFDRDLQGRPLAKMPCCRRPAATPPTGTRGVSEAMVERVAEAIVALRVKRGEYCIAKDISGLSPLMQGEVREEARAALSAATSGGEHG